MNCFDIGIIGAGVAGSFAAYKIAKQHKDLKCVLFDIGRPPLKRRNQMCGWLGCLPNSDGKLFINDLSKLIPILKSRKVNAGYSYVNDMIKNVNDFGVIKDNCLSQFTEKQVKKAGYQIKYNDYIQMHPKDIHALSRFMCEKIEEQGNVLYNFDNEVHKIFKQNSMFIINTETEEFCCKKIIVCAGRSGWKWTSELFSDFGIIDSNDIVKFGIRIEMSAASLKDFNRAHVSLLKDDVEIGPLMWEGTIIPEDHLDFAISAFRSNENRWKTDKVSFSLIGSRSFPNEAFQQIDRIGNLTFILTNDRILKEKVLTLMAGKSKISVMTEYDWVKQSVADLSEVIPDILTNAYCHIPTILPMAPSINIGKNLSTDIEGMFVAGESAGATGLLSAMITGSIVADEVCK